MARSVPSWFDFLRIEADLAKVFIDTARLHSNPSNSARSFANAQLALAEIRFGVMNPPARGLSEGEVSTLERHCREIESELATF